jgi:hypothetical protein
VAEANAARALRCTRLLGETPGASPNANIAKGIRFEVSNVENGSAPSPQKTPHALGRRSQLHCEMVRRRNRSARARSGSDRRGRVPPPRKPPVDSGLPMVTGGRSCPLGQPSSEPASSGIMPSRARLQVAPEPSWSRRDLITDHRPCRRRLPHPHRARSSATKRAGSVHILGVHGASFHMDARGAALGHDRRVRSARQL